MTTVTVSHVSKAFGPVQAVDDVSFEVYPGEIFGLLGPNGAGKTTTIRVMLDILKPDRGQVTVLGGPLDEARKNRIGYLPEERGLYKDLKLEPALTYLATLKGLDEATARQRLADWLHRFDLYDHRQKKVQELSRGMQQKAQIILTLLHEPDLIVVDEPFLGLDPVNTRLVKAIIEEQRQAGRTIVMSTHQMYQVEALCNRIVLIHEGRTVLYGTVEQIKRDFAGHAVVVEGQGDFTHLPGVLETRRQNGEWHMALEPGSSPQDVFRALAARDGIRVERFEIAEPSLDDIFITVVQAEGEKSRRTADA
ncbi:MAG: ATP-binding cassette domain-containing protein [Anaerolineae bacterium]|nr:MAG: ATP-binding cassette domain-containing protein [Anaerolineae bacterium]